MFNWREYTEDPNDAEVAAKYNEFLLSIKKYELIRRDDFILNLFKGKSVMDIGPCEHTEEYMANENWFFRKILNVSDHVVGVDINKKLVDHAQTLGLDIRYADATSEEDFKEKFDVVHAGDVIEHVSDAGGLLKFMKRHLKEDGKLVLSTPNPFYWKYFKKALKQGNCVPNFEHTSWVTPTCMNELAVREDLILKNICYPIKPSSGRRYLMNSNWGRKKIEIFSGEYIYILNLKD